MKKKPTPYDLYGTSKELESVKGVKLIYPGFSITIYRAGGSNKRYAIALQDEMKPHRQELERNVMDDETAEKVLVTAFVKGVVIGWEGVTDKNGKHLNFTVENCVKLFLDLPELFQDVQEQAGNAATFREEQERVEEKN